MTNSPIEAMARAIADAISDGYDNAFRDKREWIDGRAEKGGRSRDINEPFQVDYDAAGEAALHALAEHTGRSVEELSAASPLPDRRQEDDGWRTIENAPRDGTPFLAYGPGIHHGVPFLIRYDPDPYHPDRPWRYVHDMKRHLDHPETVTHWRSLPAPPSDREGAEPGGEAER